jgi:nucleoid-associated protein YgaU
MDQRIRLAVAASVMLGGLLVALLFRHPAAQIDLPIPGPSDQLVLRKTGPASAPVAIEPGKLPGESPAVPAAPAAGRASPTVLAPSAGTNAPPDLAKTFPEGSPTTTRWGTSTGQMFPDLSRQAAPKTHKIIDGDSLETLAKRYMGSADRANEIFEANRDVLSQPQILPIGAELKIPPKEQSAQHSSPSPTPGRMVPVANPYASR